jgi:hypothetical protein
LLAFEIINKPTAIQNRRGAHKIEISTSFPPSSPHTAKSKKLDHEGLQCSLAPVFIAGKFHDKVQYCTQHVVYGTM